MGFIQERCLRVCSEFGGICAIGKSITRPLPCSACGIFNQISARQHICVYARETKERGTFMLPARRPLNSNAIPAGTRRQQKYLTISIFSRFAAPTWGINVFSSQSQRAFEQTHEFNRPRCHKINSQTKLIGFDFL